MLLNNSALSYIICSQLRLAGLPLTPFWTSQDLSASEVERKFALMMARIKEKDESELGWWDRMQQWNKWAADAGEY